MARDMTVVEGELPEGTVMVMARDGDDVVVVVDWEAVVGMLLSGD